MRRFMAVVTGMLLAASGVTMAADVSVSGAVGANVSATAPKPKPVIKHTVKKVHHLKKKAVHKVKSKTSGTNAGASNNSSVAVNASGKGMKASASDSSDMNASAAGKKAHVGGSTDAGGQVSR